jgi:hypothetical protein
VRLPTKPVFLALLRCARAANKVKNLRALTRPRRTMIASFVDKIAARGGHIREIADYCESDVLNTYRVWLRYELFRGRLSDADFQASEACLVDFIEARGNTKPHLADLM